MTSYERAVLDCSKEMARRSVSPVSQEKTVLTFLAMVFAVGAFSLLVIAISLV